MLNAFASLKCSKNASIMYKSLPVKQGRLLSDWLICHPSTQTLFERALLNFLKTKMASERAISCWLYFIACSGVSGKCWVFFYFVLLFRMAGKCWVIKLKRFVGYRFRFYWQATVSLVASPASCCRLYGGKMFHNRCQKQVPTARMQRLEKR